MRFELARRLLVLVLSVALATGFVTRSVHALAMDIKAPAAATVVASKSSGMPMSGECSGCTGSEKAMMSAACSAFCGSAVALPPVVVAFDPGLVDTVEPSAAPAATGRTFPPDPGPPRSPILS
jgi:hypothetical protein